jgi:hypothetical protein
MSKHTPEPWHLPAGSTCIHDANGNEVPRCEQNERRKVRCVNAMAGIPDKNALFLDGNGVRKTLVRIEADRLNLEAQRDELLAALKLYEQAFDGMFAQCCSNGMTDAWGRPVDCTLLNEAHCAAESAITKAEQK